MPRKTRREPPGGDGRGNDSFRDHVLWADCGLTICYSRYQKGRVGSIIFSEEKKNDLKMEFLKNIVKVGHLQVSRGRTFSFSGWEGSEQEMGIWGRWLQRTGTSGSFEEADARLRPPRTVVRCAPCAEGHAVGSAWGPRSRRPSARPAARLGQPGGSAFLQLDACLPWPRGAARASRRPEPR